MASRSSPSSFFLSMGGLLVELALADPLQRVARQADHAGAGGGAHTEVGSGTFGGIFLRQGRNFGFDVSLTCVCSLYIFAGIEQMRLWNFEFENVHFFLGNKDNFDNSIFYWCQNPLLGGNSSNPDDNKPRGELGPSLGQILAWLFLVCCILYCIGIGWETEK